MFIRIGYDIWNIEEILFIYKFDLYEDRFGRTSNHYYIIVVRKNQDEYKIEYKSDKERNVDFNRVAKILEVK